MRCQFEPLTNVNREGDTDMTPQKREIRGPLDLTGDIIAYENGTLDREHTIVLFQQLVYTGLAWQLQGHYGRTAAALLEAGEILP